VGAGAPRSELTYTRLGLDEFTAGLTQQGVPEDEAALLRYLFTAVLDGRNAHVTDGVQRALGRPPRDFSDCARAAAARGACNGRRQ
jgi:hypothetical protein